MLVHHLRVEYLQQRWCPVLIHTHNMCVQEHSSCPDQQPDVCAIQHLRFLGMSSELVESFFYFFFNIILVRFKLFSNRLVKHLLSISGTEQAAVRLLPIQAQSPGQLPSSVQHHGDRLGQLIFAPSGPERLASADGQKFQSSSQTWEVKLSYREEIKFASQVKDSNRGRQKYARYMEK